MALAPEVELLDNVSDLKERKPQPTPLRPLTPHRERIISIDTEFVPNDLTPAGLVSIALTDGERELYAVNLDMDWDKVTEWKKPWMLDNVVRHLPTTADGRLATDHPDVATHATIAIRIKQYLDADLGYTGIRLVAHCGAQDMVRLHTLWDNDWSQMASSVPTSFKDIKEERLDLGLKDSDLPPMADESLRHHALHDARHELRTFQWLQLMKAVTGGRR